MSEELIASLYPPPPPYYKYFTKANIDKFAELSESEKAELTQGALHLQIPPDIPQTDQYRGYGSVWSLENKIPSLKSLGFTQLYQDEDETITSNTKIAELHKLLDSLLLNFLELVGSVSVEPAKFYIKIEHLKQLIINMNHLLNTYRPHQTRESLIMLLQKLIESKREETALIEKTMLQAKKDILDLVKDEKELVRSTAHEGSATPDSSNGMKAQLEAIRSLLQQM